MRHERSAGSIDSCLEPHDRRAGVALGELGQHADVGAVPAVDRLVGVADDAQVGAVAEPGLEQAELQRVDVLELVDEEVAEAPALGRRRSRGRRSMRLRRTAEQVVEVDQRAARASRPRSARRASAIVAPASGGVRPARASPRPRSRRVRPSGPWPTRSRRRRRRAAPARRRRSRHERAEQPHLALEQRRRRARRGRPSAGAAARRRRRGTCPPRRWPRTPRPRSRLASSPAALRVKVSASTWRGRRDPSRPGSAMRRVSTRVLPEPAPARMQSGRAVARDRGALRVVEVGEQVHRGHLRGGVGHCPVTAHRYPQGLWKTPLGQALIGGSLGKTRFDPE